MNIHADIADTLPVMVTWPSCVRAVPPRFSKAGFMALAEDTDVRGIGRWTVVLDRAACDGDFANRTARRIQQNIRRRRCVGAMLLSMSQLPMWIAHVAAARNDRHRRCN